MSARNAAALLLVLLLAPAAEAGWFGGKKKLPKPIKMVEIRPHDGARLNKPTKVLSNYDSTSWGGLGKVFYQPQRKKVPHYLEF